EDRDRADGPRVDLEHEQGEHEPEPADDEVEPPELGRLFGAWRRGVRRSAKAARGVATLSRFPDGAGNGDDVAAPMADVTLPLQTPPATAQNEWFRLQPDEVAAAMNVDPATGLTS